jgi:methylmalonyl-CoA mutase cobalamin-binding domain/chain
MNDTEYTHHRTLLIAMIINAERTEAVDLICSIAAQIGYPAVITHVLDPALIEIGDMWAREKLSLAQGYVAAKITEDVLLKAVDTKEWQAETAEMHIPVVLASIEDDFHPLGRKMVSTFLQLAGWTVHDMGNDITAEEMVDKAVELNAPIIGVSAMMYTSALNIGKVRQEIDRRGLQDKLKLAVGGAIFKVRATLVEEVGGDGTAASAIDAPQLFSDLLKTIRP